MNRYLLLRFLKAILSIFIVVAIVIVMVFTLMPEDNLFKDDKTFAKLRGNEKITYRLSTLESLGYLEYVNIGQMCARAEDKSGQCTVNDSPEQNAVLKEFEDKGFVIGRFLDEGNLKNTPYGYRKFGSLELLKKYFTRLFHFDTPNRIQNANDPKLETDRGYHFGTDHNGVPALTCYGCENKYQIYFNGKFPFIHQNFLSFEFGRSFPTNPGSSTTEVISEPQGSQKRREITFPTGHKSTSAEDLHSLQYKHSIDHLDEQKYEDHYASAKILKDAPSMIGMSYIFGIIALVLSYMLALPWGIAMARNKGKMVDKLGIAYINLLIAVPSLALIFVLKYIGSMFGFPDKFPQLGPHNIRSYIMPIVVMVIIGMPGIMTWIRRYMIDQQSADYVKFARAKGLSRNEISKNHILKNAVIPIVNGIPSSIVLQIVGAIYTETIFAIPGMGKMLPDAMKAGNNNMIITLTFIFTSLAIFAQFAGDILMTWVDPRISLDNGKGEV
ncbi:ABC transporter permease [Helcococcus massiliensis]|uniref:ABC transporter permease n=1 Tax=Helcococcus massiliensis TaxID=2040290 RepID=UPI000CDE9727|nr:ABC transporter permease [Helcococcus massiliensis]